MHSLRRRIGVAAAVILSAAAVLTGVLTIDQFWPRPENAQGLGATALPRPPSPSGTKLLATASAVLAAGNHSIADHQLQTEVRKTILSFYRSVRSCQRVSVGAIQLTTPLDTAGSWQETWTVDACGQAATLVISFTPDGNGGFFYDIAEGHP